MTIYPKSVNDIDHGLATLRKAVDSYLSRPVDDAFRKEHVLAEDYTRVSVSDTPVPNVEINASDVQTKLIQITAVLRTLRLRPDLHPVRPRPIPA